MHFIAISRGDFQDISCRAMRPARTAKQSRIVARGRARTWIGATPRAGTFARAGGIERARTVTRFATPALLWRWCAQNAGRRPIEKARGRFPGAGSNIPAMLNLCR
jgi:hypothetical protein